MWASNSSIDTALMARGNADNSMLIASADFEGFVSSEDNIYSIANSLEERVAKLETLISRTDNGATNNVRAELDYQDSKPILNLKEGN